MSFLKPPRPGQKPAAPKKGKGRKKTPPRRAAVKKSEERVWISCRATAGCEGKHAIKSFSKPLAGGGHAHRYKCTTCRGAFHITV